MARLFKHKDVEDYFATFDYATKDPAELPKVVKLYEAGKVIVLENARVDFDRDFIGSVEFPNEDPFKKFKFRPLRQGVLRDGHGAVVHEFSEAAATVQSSGGAARARVPGR
jgi:hypothetical protein